MELKSFKRICLDIEANGLLHQLVDFSSLPLKLKIDTAKLWLVVLTDMDNPQESVILELEECNKNNLKECFKNCEELVYHNGTGYDMPVLKLFDIIEYDIYFYQDRNGNNGEVFGKPLKLVDTLVWSKLMCPDRFGGHSLEAWGERTGTFKTDYRQVCIDQNLIDAKSPKGFEFSQYFFPMKDYCTDDTLATIATYNSLLEERHGWKVDNAYHMEMKLVDLTVKQEFYGFAFDKELALKNLEFLNKALDDRRALVNPLLPPKKLNKTEASSFMPPKTQFKKNGDLSSNLLKFIEKLGASTNEDKTEMYYEGRTYSLPLNPEVCVKETIDADIEDLDHLKRFLMDQGWIPSEWKVRDLTKPSGKKVRLPDDKIKETLDRYIDGTLSGLFKEDRLKLLETTEDKLRESLHDKLHERSIIVPLTPCLKVGTAKELCPNLETLGKNAEFVKYVVEYLTYKHRRNSIAGGDPDPETGEHSKGYLSQIEANGRIRTPADTNGANTRKEGRYKHKIVANIPRPSSLFGLEMRSMFGAGENRIELGLDYSAVEARIQGHYCYKYTDGPELAKMLVADKPNSVHCISSDTLLLSSEGWKGIDEVDENTVMAQWSKSSSEITFVKPDGIVKRELNPDEYMVHIHGDRLDILVTNNHRMIVYNTDTYEYVDVLAGNLKEYCRDNPNCYIPASGYNTIEDSLEYLIEYYVKQVPNFFEEIIEKDFGYVVYSKDLSLIEEVQEELLLNNCVSIIHTKYRGSTPVYQTLIPKRIGNLKGHYLKHAVIDEVHHGYDKRIWCINVPTSYIIAKRNNKIAIVGNCINAKRMGITRDQAKTFGYSILYGAGPPKLAKSLGVSLNEAKRLYEEYWQGLPAMLELKTNIEKFWEKSGKTYIVAVDGRKLNVRSKHSLLNLLFQSAGALIVKYAIVEVLRRLEELKLLGDPFKHSGQDDKCYMMILYHK